jgi:hypothetical protein
VSKHDHREHEHSKHEHSKHEHNANIGLQEHRSIVTRAHQSVPGTKLSTREGERERGSERDSVRGSDRGSERESTVRGRERAHSPASMPSGFASRFLIVGLGFERCGYLKSSYFCHHSEQHSSVGSARTSFVEVLGSIPGSCTLLNYY